MASVDIILADIAGALREAVIVRTIERVNANYVPAPPHAPKCAGLYVPTNVEEVQAEFSWDHDKGGRLRIEMRDVPCLCYQYSADHTVVDVFTVGELFMLILEER